MKKSQKFYNDLDFKECNPSESDTKSLLKHAEDLIGKSKRNREEIEKTLNQIDTTKLSCF